MGLNVIKNSVIVTAFPMNKGRQARSMHFLLYSQSFPGHKSCSGRMFYGALDFLAALLRMALDLRTNS
jgi:hypothetical protein